MVDENLAIQETKLETEKEWHFVREGWIGVLSDVNVCEVRICILALQFFAKGMELQIEDFSSLELGQVFDHTFSNKRHQQDHSGLYRSCRAPSGKNLLLE
ncbi:hypothetical protein QQP08_017735, partial [Theobroma cacao]